MEFYQFKKDVELAFNAMMQRGKLFVVDADKELLWMAYLLSFPEGEERQQHNCNTCKSFIRHLGKAVAINPETYEIETFWDNVHTPGFEKIAESLANVVRECAVCNILMQNPGEFHGCDHNVVQLPDGTTHTWYHLYINLPSQYRFDKRRSNFYTLEGLKGDIRSRAQVFKRSLTELDATAVETVIELIEDNSLYRGAEFLKSLQEFLRSMKDTNTLTSAQLENYCWLHYDSPIAKIRNTAMGTLLINLSDGMALESAVKAYEQIMAPANYKRPKALITKKQIEAAQKKVEELGLTDALPRRHAQVEDISVNDVLFVNRDTSKRMKDGDVFSMLSESQTVNPKEYNNKATEVSIDKFLSDIMPGSSKIEVLVENRHISNFVTLTAPVNPDAGNMFKWNNNFAWVYNGSVADSFKEKVKAAGGRIDGDIRCSLHWFNYDDLDLHVVSSGGDHIYYGCSHGRSGGILDVDMNAGSGTSRDAVENVVWADKNRIPAGTYEVLVNQFSCREKIDVGFEFEIEICGELHKFNYDKVVRGNVIVARLQVDKNHNVTLIPVLPEGSTSQKSVKEWNIDTIKFHEVSCIMLSPNYWGGEGVGNKHFFFMLNECKNPDPVRGFFNEYLRSDLEQNHKRVFEAIGSRAKVEYNDNQLSGLGFSSASKNDVVVKVDNKLFKIKF